MFEVETTALVQTAQMLDAGGSSLAALSNRLRSVASKRTMSGKAYANVMGSVYAVARRFDVQSTHGHSLASVARDVSALYASTENDVLTQGRVKLSKRIVPTGEQREQNPAQDTKPDSNDNWFRRILEQIKSVLAFIGEAADSKTSDAGSGLASYIKSLIEFFDKDGWQGSGMKEFLGLCGESGGLWSKLYEAVTKHYGVWGTGGIGLFTLANQKNVGIFGVASSVTGLASTITGFFENDYENGFDFASEVISEGGQGVTEVARSVYDYKGLVDAARGVTQTGAKGVWTVASKWAAVANAGFAVVGQLTQSIGEYSQDGWSVEDTAATGIDIGVSGLYAMVDTLSFGILSEETTSVSAKDISTGLKNWAKDLGTWLGKKSIEGGWSWVFGG